MYNKRQFTKANDKRVLHKVRKQWITISVALFALIGGGAIASHVNASANSNDNNNNNDTQSQTSNIDQPHSKLITAPQHKLQGNQRNSNNTSLQSIQHRANQVHRNILTRAMMNAPTTKIGSSNNNGTSQQNRVSYGKAVNGKPAKSISDINQLHMHHAANYKGYIFSRINTPFKNITINRPALLHNQIFLNEDHPKYRVKHGNVKILKAYKQYGTGIYTRYLIHINHKNHYITGNNHFVSFVAPSKHYQYYQRKINNVLNDANNHKFNKVRKAVKKLNHKHVTNYKRYMNLYINAYNLQQDIQHPVVVNYHHKYIRSQQNNSGDNQSASDLVNSLETPASNVSNNNFDNFSSLPSFNMPNIPAPINPSIPSNNSNSDNMPASSSASNSISSPISASTSASLSGSIASSEINTIRNDSSSINANDKEAANDDNIASADLSNLNVSLNANLAQEKNSDINEINSDRRLLNDLNNGNTSINNYLNHIVLSDVNSEFSNAINQLNATNEVDSDAKDILNNVNSLKSETNKQGSNSSNNKPSSSNNSSASSSNNVKPNKPSSNSSSDITSASNAVQSASSALSSASNSAKNASSVFNSVKNQDNSEVNVYNSASQNYKLASKSYNLASNALNSASKTNNSVAKDSAQSSESTAKSFESSYSIIMDDTNSIYNTYALASASDSNAISVLNSAYRIYSSANHIESSIINNINNNKPNVNPQPKPNNSTSNSNNASSAAKSADESIANSYRNSILASVSTANQSKAKSAASSADQSIENSIASSAKNSADNSIATSVSNSVSSSVLRLDISIANSYGASVSNSVSSLDNGIAKSAANSADKSINDSIASSAASFADKGIENSYHNWVSNSVSALDNSIASSAAKSADESIEASNTASASQASVINRFISKMFKDVNQARQVNHLNKLQSNNDLENISKLRAKQIISNNNSSFKSDVDKLGYMELEANLGSSEITGHTFTNAINGKLLADNMFNSSRTDFLDKSAADIGIGMAYNNKDKNYYLVIDETTKIHETPSNETYLMPDNNGKSITLNNIYSDGTYNGYNYSTTYGPVYISKSINVIGYNFDLITFSNQNNSPRYWVFSDELSKNSSAKFTNTNEWDEFNNALNKNGAKYYTSDELNKINGLRQRYNCLLKYENSNDISTSDKMSDYRQHVIDWVNFYRNLHGLHPVAEDSSFDSYAQKHAEIEKDPECMIINGPSNTATNPGNPAIAPSQIIDYYTDTNDADRNGTPGHRVGLLNPRATKIGVGEQGFVNTLYFGNGVNNPIIDRPMNITYPNVGIYPINYVNQGNSDYWGYSFIEPNTINKNAIPKTSDFNPYPGSYNGVTANNSDIFVTVHDDTINSDIGVSDIHSDQLVKDGQINAYSGAIYYKVDTSALKFNHKYTITISGKGIPSYQYTTQLFNLYDN